MTALLIFHPLARKLYNAVFPLQTSRGENRGSARLNQRASFDFAFALLFLVALHGFSSLKILLILYINYQLGAALPRKYVAPATWIFNIGILFANDLCNGYQYKDIASLISPAAPTMEMGATQPFLIRWGAWLDSYGGILSRWDIMFNITILRLISFNMDRHWAKSSNHTSVLEVCEPPQLLAQFLSRGLVLIRQRRSNWTRRTFLRRTGLRSPPTFRTTTSATTSLMLSTRPSTSQGPS